MTNAEAIAEATKRWPPQGWASEVKVVSPEWEAASAQFLVGIIKYNMTGHVVYGCGLDYEGAFEDARQNGHNGHLGA